MNKIDTWKMCSNSMCNYRNATYATAYTDTNQKGASNQLTNTSKSHYIENKVSKLIKHVFRWGVGNSFRAQSVNR